MNVILPREVRPSEQTLYIVRQVAYKYRCPVPRSKVNNVFN